MKTRTGVLITTIILLLFPVPLLAGQSAFLQIKSYLPDTEAHITYSQCMQRTGPPKINQTVMLKSDDTGFCFFQKSLMHIVLDSHGVRLSDFTILLSSTGSSVTPEGLQKNGHYIVTSLLYPHHGLTGSSDHIVVTIALPEDHWMSDNANILATKHLNAILLPGSHDTGTSSITSQSAVMPDISSNKILNELLTKLKIGNITTAHWSRTQTFPVATQLQLGIRYLDLRLCKVDGDPVLHTCHGLAGENLESILRDTENFLAEPSHQKELIILDMNHYHHLDSTDINTLHAMLLDIFGSRIASYGEFTPESLLGSLWKKSKQVIVISADDETAKLWPDVFWPASTIYSPWPNKQDPSALENSMQDALSHRNKQTLFVLQSQETPLPKNIIQGLDPLQKYPVSLLELTGEYKLHVKQWLHEPSQEKLLKENGNIIMEDFTNGIELTELAKKYE